MEDQIKESKFTINVKTFANFREIIGAKETIYLMDKRISIWNFILFLINKYPLLQEILINHDTIRKNVILMINDSVLSIDEIKSKMFNSNQTLIILPPAGGGKI